jgi:hypothetical protein
MHLFSSEQDIRIKKAVKSIKNYVVNSIADRGMLALFLAGTILSKKERKQDSDIDFFAIVKDDFDFRLENMMNEMLEKRKQDICLGFESRIRCFHLDYLRGEPGISPVEKFMKAERLVQRFPYYKLAWGERFDFSKFAKPMELKKEAEYLIKQMRGNISDLRSGNLKFPVDDFPKLLFEIIRVEAQLFHKYKYHPDRHRLVKHLKREENHIVQEAWKFRQSTTNANEMLDFSSRIEKYLNDLEKAIQ